MNDPGTRFRFSMRFGAAIMGLIAGFDSVSSLAMADEVVAPAPALTPAPATEASGKSWTVLIVPQGEAIEFGADGQVAQRPVVLAPPAGGKSLPSIHPGETAAPLLPLPTPEATQPISQPAGEAASEAPAGPLGESAVVGGIPYPNAPHFGPNVAHYADVYRQIPFSRAEYEANPSYRHDATMEFLFGKLRPTVVQRGTAPPPRSQGINYLPTRFTYPDFSPSDFYPAYRYYPFLGGWRGGYAPFPLGYFGW